MTDKNIDELLKSLSTETKEEAVVNQLFQEEQSKREKISDWIMIHLKVIIPVGVVLVIGTVLLVNYTNNRKQANLEQEQIKQSQLSVNKNKQEADANKKESSYFLSKAEYQANINYLAKSDTGLKHDKEKGLTGTLTVDGKTETVLSYTRRDGVLHTIDSDQQAVSHSNKWVRAYIAKLKAKRSLASDTENN